MIRGVGAIATTLYYFSTSFSCSFCYYCRSVDVVVAFTIAKAIRVLISIYLSHKTGYKASIRLIIATQPGACVKAAKVKNDIFFCVMARQSFDLAFFFCVWMFLVEYKMRNSCWKLKFQGKFEEKVERGKKSQMSRWREWKANTCEKRKTLIQHQRVCCPQTKGKELKEPKKTGSATNNLEIITRTDRKFDFVPTVAAQSYLWLLWRTPIHVFAFG